MPKSKKEKKCHGQCRATQKLDVVCQQGVDYHPEPGPLEEIATHPLYTETQAADIIADWLEKNYRYYKNGSNKKSTSWGQDCARVAARLRVAAYDGLDPGIIVQCDACGWRVDLEEPYRIENEGGRFGRDTYFHKDCTLADETS